jgi:type I restriction enzyme, S subunit
VSLTISPARIVEESDSPLLAAPDSWPRRPLGEIATILNGYAFKSKQFVADGGTPLIRIRDIFNDYTAVGYVGDFDNRYLVEPGQLLVGMDGDFNCARWSGPEALLNQRVCKITPDSTQLDLDYLTHILPGYLQAIHDLTSSTTVTHLSSRDVAQIPIPVPPLAEQRALASLFGFAATKQGSSGVHIQTARRGIERFRQAVLGAACSGLLTADWREQNPDCEGAEKLVSRSAYSIAEPEEGLAELPDKWAWVALGDYARCSRGRFSVRPRNDPSCFGGEHPFIQIGNLNPDGGWVRSHSQTLNAKGLSVSKKFPKGTAVIAIVGATIGNTGLLAYDMCFPDSLVGLETGTPEGNRFVELFLRDRKHAIRQASYSSGGQPNINLESLNPYPLALPPLAEQREIVRRVDRLLTLADGLQRRVNNAARRVDRSSQAVLAKAFRGELVTTGEGVAGE